MLGRFFSVIVSEPKRRLRLKLSVPKKPNMIIFLRVKYQGHGGVMNEMQMMDIHEMCTCASVVSRSKDVYLNYSL